MIRVAVLGGPDNGVSSSSKYPDHPTHPVRELHGEEQPGILHHHGLPLGLSDSQQEDTAAQVSEAAAEGASSVIPRPEQTSVLREAGEQPWGHRAAGPDPSGSEAVPGGHGEDSRAGPGDEADTWRARG